MRSMDTILDKDRELIARLGGPAKVADLLQLSKARGRQRVHNWLSRGIPAAVKVRRPDLFMPADAALAPAPIPERQAS